MKVEAIGILFFLALQCVIVLTQTQCPNNCSGNGWCTPERVCNCNNGWRGEDCSISTEPLTVNRERRGSVEKFQWRFFQYTVSSGKAHRLTLSHQNNQDPDLFLRRNVLPTRSQYDYSDMGLGNVSYINVRKQNESALWFAGVYGFTKANFTIIYQEFSTNCPLDCSNHGTCDPETEICRCNKGWGDASCSTQIPASPIQTWTEPTTLQRSKWLYRYFEIPSGTPAFRLNVEELDNNSDVDIYIKKGEIPSFSHWDYADRTLDKNSWINVTRPNEGVYYIGYYGFKESTFRWRLILETQSDSCPGRCSEHGECRSGTCHCEADYTGDNCEFRTTELMQNQNVSGYVVDNVFNYYYITTHTSSNLVIDVSHDDGDCDLYIHQNDNLPTRFNYLYSHLALDKEFSLTIPNPGNNKWNIGVYGYRACRYTLKAHVGSTGCPPCVHGRCSEGQTICLCDEGWGGDDCSIPVEEISNNQRITGTVAPSQFKYFKFKGSASAFHIVLDDPRGVAWLFVSIMAPPTINRYDFSDTKLFTKTHRISIEIGQYIPETEFYIGVYGSPFAVDNVTFQLVTWAAPFK